MTTITLEPDPPPIVRILAATLRRSAAQPELARRIDRLRGRVALRSTTDPQAATIHFDRGSVSITRGARADADVVISADLSTMGRPGAPRPKVRGALTHVRLALGAARVLDPPVPGGWEGAAERLWSWAEGRRGRPARLRLVCTDDGRERTFGDATSGDAGGTCELHGPAWALTAVLTGGDHLGQALLEGRVRGVADLPVASELVGLMTAHMLGDT